MTAEDGAKAREQRQLLAQSRQLYERFGIPLERDHLGQYVAITTDGRTLVGTSAREVGRRAKATFGPGNFVFKIGSRVVGRWR